MHAVTTVLISDLAFLTVSLKTKLLKKLIYSSDSDSLVETPPNVGNPDPEYIYPNMAQSRCSN